MSNELKVLFLLSPANLFIAHLKKVGDYQKVGKFLISTLSAIPSLLISLLILYTTNYFLILHLYIKWINNASVQIGDCTGLVQNEGSLSWYICEGYSAVLGCVIFSQMTLFHGPLVLACMEAPHMKWEMDTLPPIDIQNNKVSSSFWLLLWFFKQHILSKVACAFF